MWSLCLSWSLANNWPLIWKHTSFMLDNKLCRKVVEYTEHEYIQSLGHKFTSPNQYSSLLPSRAFLFFGFFGLLLTDSFHRGKHGLHTHLVATGMSIVFSQWFWSWFVDLVGAKKDFCAQSSKLDVDCGMENLITKSSVQLQLQKNKRRPHILMFFCYFFVRLSHQVACKEVQMPLKEILNKQVGSKT